MLRKSEAIARRNAAKKQFMEDEDYNKWTEALEQLEKDAMPEKPSDAKKSINDTLGDRRF